jgi:hypothetical protein
MLANLAMPLIQGPSTEFERGLKRYFFLRFLILVLEIRYGQVEIICSVELDDENVNDVEIGE